MRKSILLILFFLVCLNGYGQVMLPPASITNSGKNSDNKQSGKTCLMEYSQMPLVKGVRIGMSYENVKELYPEIETNEWFQKNYRVDKSGLFMIPAKEISNEEFKQDLTQLSLNFENDEIRIYNFIFKSKKWKSLEEMIDNMSEMFGVDADYWSVFNQESIQMKCVDFNVAASHLNSSGKTLNSIAVHKK